MSDLKSMLPKFTELNELASISNGGQIMFSTDDWFAVAENMLADSEPIFIADKYTECGKWMDGWETRRKRIAGHDWCILKLGAPCIVKGVIVDTAFFTGNFAPRISIQGARLFDPEDRMAPARVSKMGTACTNEELSQALKLRSDQWTELVPMTKMRPGYEETRRNYIAADGNEVVSHIRVNMFPDGGIARLRVFGEVQSNVANISASEEIDLISLQNGGTCVAYSNAHYGHPRNLIKPGRGINMGDGWETMRRLDRPAILQADADGMLQVPGCEWAILKMSCMGHVNRVVVDTHHFKGNFPDSVKIEGAVLKEEETLTSANWTPILSNQKLSAHREHHYANELRNDGPFNHVRITMAPDGGFSRVRIFGNKV